jgi:hypothetical protein
VLTLFPRLFDGVPISHRLVFCGMYITGLFQRPLISPIFPSLCYYVNYKYCWASGYAMFKKWQLLVAIILISSFNSLICTTVFARYWLKWGSDKICYLPFCYLFFISSFSFFLCFNNNICLIYVALHIPNCIVCSISKLPMEILHCCNCWPYAPMMC